MGHIRVQDDTKKRSDLIFAALKAKNPDIKTYDDFQIYLLDKAEVKSLPLIIRGDVDKVGSHLHKLYPGIDPNSLKSLMEELFTLMIENKTSKKCKLSTKRLNELSRELGGK